jgi:hypothetical protein
MRLAERGTSLSRAAILFRFILGWLGRYARQTQKLGHEKAPLFVCPIDSFAHQYLTGFGVLYLDQVVVG